MANEITVTREGKERTWIIRNPTPAVRALEAREKEFASHGGFCYIWNEDDHVKVEAKTGAAHAFLRALEKILESERVLPPTPRQIEYALALLARHDEPLIGGGIVKPTPDQVRSMDRTKISDLIDMLRRDIRHGVE